MCAITSAKTLFSQVIATDLAPARLKLAEKHGAVAVSAAELVETVKKATDGLGADAVLEVVGHPAALKTAMELARPYGVISSCGVHTHQVNLDGAMLYDKK